MFVVNILATDTNYFIAEFRFDVSSGYRGVSW